MCRDSSHILPIGSVQKQQFDSDKYFNIALDLDISLSSLSHRMYVITRLLIISAIYHEILGIDVELGVEPFIQILKPSELANSKPNGEVIGRENERFALLCFAPYPIQWSYAGSGSPEYFASTSQFMKQVNGEKQIHYRAELRIEAAKEVNTGQYRCSSTEFPNVFAYFYVYVPGPALFIASTGQHLQFSKKDTSILIPCVVSQKEARVSLKKSVAEVLQKVETLEGYDPRIGFRLNAVKMDPTGTYVCTASYGNLYRLIEYTVTPEEASLRTNTSSCTPSPCALNAECNIINLKPICQCTEGFVGDPYVGSCRKPCPNGNLDCPVQFFCNATSGTCESPCRNYVCDSNVAECTVTDQRPRCIKKQRGSVMPVPCGRNRNCGPGSKCELIKGQPTCICANGQPLLSQETTCTAACQRDSDCPLALTCDYPTCVSSCEKFNPCGPNTKCRMSRHSSMCECKPGHFGDPLKGCQALDSETLIRLRPTNTRKPPSYSESCETHAHCPSNKACIDGRCRNPCNLESACGIDAVCTAKYHTVLCKCGPGYTGDPLEKCIDSSKKSGPPLSTTTPAPYSRRCPPALCSGNTLKRTTATADNQRYSTPNPTDVLLLS